MTNVSTTTQRLLHTPGSELDELFGRSPAGQIPVGNSEGTVLFAPGSAAATPAAYLVRLIAWKGKIFDPHAQALRNKVGPLGTPAIAATVYYGSSWVDARQAIVLDYSRTSRVARWIRDEIREVAPGVFLGIVYWSRHRILKFVLDFTRTK